ncbi:oligogalacturonate lyase family protein [Natronorubrum halophilum]|uniref:oligogalacturonate lyase family protein n=1 Tax=Natronorubrum halophilum TaxID=1702106 RepID=UPI000EF67184|nr:oligogalacturonate lyase family protein [Natronorubrum halophilum]
MEDELRQGPNAGRTLPAEREQYDDPETGASVTRLTSDPEADSRHLYFTEPGWDDDGRRLLFRSDRGGTRQLYSVALESGELTQLTDLPDDISGVTRIATEPTALFWCDERLVALDLETLAVTLLYELPDGYTGSIAAGTADGQRAVTALSEALDLERDPDDRERWIADRMDAGPHSKVISIPLSGGEPMVHVENDRWLNHVNASPTRPELVTYAEEGLWEDVDRIRALDLETDETWVVRPTDADEAVGHEYWLADGETIGYHGWRGGRDDPDAFFGHVRYDGTDRREWPAPDLYTHFHSNTRNLVVGDGTYRGAPFDLLWSWDDEDGGYRTPRKLVAHGWSGDDDVHPHSRLSPNGDRVVFDSSRAREGTDSDVYLVDVPDDLEELPTFDGL